jgi:O-antigen ligase
VSICQSNEIGTTVRRGVSIGIATTLVCSTLLAVLAFVFFSDWLANWIAVGVLGIALALILTLYLVLSSRAHGLHPDRITLRLALVLWFYLLISEEIFDRATGIEIEGVYSVVVYGEICLWILAGIALLVILIRNHGWLYPVLLGRSKWVFAFAAVCTLSALYSPQPRFSGAWAVKLILVVSVLATCSGLIFDETDLLALVKVTFWACCYLLLYGTFSDLPRWYLEGRLGKSPTSLAVLSGIVLILSLMMLSLRKLVWPRIFLVSAPLIMILTAGKAGIAGGLFSGVLYFALKRKLGSAVGLLVGLAILGLLLFLLSAPLQNYAGAYIENDQVDNLSGRTNLWSAALPLIRESPFLGHGYMASKFISLRVEHVGWEAGHLHNAFLDVLYNNGLVGLSLILYINFCIVANLIHVFRTPWISVSAREIAIAFLAIYSNLLINAFFNAMIGGRPSALFMIFLAVFMISESLRRNLPAGASHQAASNWVVLSLHADNAAEV